MFHQFLFGVCKIVFPFANVLAALSTVWHGARFFLLRVSLSKNIFRQTVRLRESMQEAAFSTRSCIQILREGGKGFLYPSVIRDLFDNSIAACKTGTEQNIRLVLSTVVEARKKENWHRCNTDARSLLNNLFNSAFQAVFVLFVQI